MELYVVSSTAKSVGAVGGTTGSGFVVALVVAEAEPLALIAVNRKLYVVFASKSKNIALLPVGRGTVHVVHSKSVDFLYSNVYSVNPV